MLKLPVARGPLYAAAVFMMLTFSAWSTAKWVATPGSDLLDYAKMGSYLFFGFAFVSAGFAVAFGGRGDNATPAATPAAAAVPNAPSFSDADLAHMDPKERKAFIKAQKLQEKRDKKFQAEARKEAAKAARQAKRGKKDTGDGDLMDAETSEDWIKAIREANMDPVDDHPAPTGVVYDLNPNMAPGYAPPVNPTPPTPVIVPVAVPAPAFTPEPIVNAHTGSITDTPMFEPDMTAPVAPPVEPEVPMILPVFVPEMTEPEPPVQEEVPAWLTAAYTDPTFVPPYDDPITESPALEPEPAFEIAEPVEDLPIFDDLLGAYPEEPEGVLVEEEPEPITEADDATEVDEPIEDNTHVEEEAEPAMEDTVEETKPEGGAHRAEFPVSDQFLVLVNQMEEVLANAAERTELAEAEAAEIRATMDTKVADAVADAERRMAVEIAEAQAEVEAARAERDELTATLNEMEGNLDQVLHAQAALANAEKARVAAKVRQARAALRSKIDADALKLLDTLLGDVQGE